MTIHTTLLPTSAAQVPIDVGSLTISSQTVAADQDLTVVHFNTSQPPLSPEIAARLSGLSGAPTPDQEPAPEEPTVTGTMDLPPHVDIVYTDTVPTGSLLRVEAHTDGCLDCGHLIPGDDREFYERCHFTRGNSLCPAASVQIVFVGLRKSLLKRIQRAKETGESNRVMRLFAELDKQSAEDKNWVLSQLNLL